MLVQNVRLQLVVPVLAALALVVPVFGLLPAVVAVTALSSAAELRWRPVETLALGVATFGERMFDLLLDGSRFTTAACAFRRDAALAAGLFDERLVYNEDTDFFLRLALRGRFASPSPSSSPLPAKPYAIFTSARPRAAALPAALAPKRSA